MEFEPRRSETCITTITFINKTIIGDKDHAI